MLLFNVKKEDVKEDNIVYFTIGNNPTLIPSKIVRIDSEDCHTAVAVFNAETLHVCSDKIPAFLLNQ